MECLRTGVRFPPPPPTTGPIWTDKGRTPTRVPAFLFSVVRLSAAAHTMSTRHHASLRQDAVVSASHAFAVRGMHAREPFLAEWPCEVEPLGFVATFVSKKCNLLDAFHALCDHLESQRVGERDDGPRDRAVLLVVRQSTHELAVDLQRADRKPLEICQARIAGAEVVDVDLHAQRVQALEER